jgi:hypothetical protein
MLNEKNLPRVITPRPYPSRRATLLGMASFKDADLQSITDAFQNPNLLIKYTVMLESCSKRRMLVAGTVVTHLELAEWCDWKGYTLFSLDKSPELARSHERTELG